MVLLSETAKGLQEKLLVIFNFLKALESIH
jgi:hypothetical protein